MRIAFVDLSGIAFTPFTPDHMPLGGMQSGVCYLARALTARGHEVTVFNAAAEDGIHSGIRVLDFDRHCSSLKHSFDACVSISCEGARLRPLVGNMPLVLFTGHNNAQASMQVLARPEERDCWDQFVFKSNWQAESICKKFSLDRRKISIITNAISPAFQSIPERSSYFFLEKRPPVLYFASTPFRGLDILVKAFPTVREAFPGVRAKIFSSMSPYHVLGNDERYADLYERCRQAGMDYIGSLSQPALARQAAEADVLAFPSTYEETSCITLMEAMANSAIVVTRARGAIPETGAGFAYLLPEDQRTNNPRLPANFASYLVNVLRAHEASPRRAAQRLKKQRNYSLTNYAWPHKAQEWEELLSRLQQGATESIIGRTPPKSGTASWPVYNYVQTQRGKRIYIDPRDGRAKRMLLHGGSFNPQTLALWNAALRSAAWDMIVDVGANYGEMLVERGVECCPRVLAVEPNPNVLPYLRRTVESMKNVTVLELALSREEGEQPFFLNRDWSGMSCLGKGELIVKTGTIDGLVQSHSARSVAHLSILLKIDVEGGELDVLAGALATLRSAKHMCCLVEISCLKPEALDSLERHFHVFGLDLRENRIRKLSGLRALPAGESGYWHQDVLLERRRGADLQGAFA